MVDENYMLQRELTEEVSLIGAKIAINLICDGENHSYLITFNTAHWLDYNKFCMKVDPCVMPPLRFGCWSYTL